MRRIPIVRRVGLPPPPPRALWRLASQSSGAASDVTCTYQAALCTLQCKDPHSGRGGPISTLASGGPFAPAGFVGRRKADPQPRPLTV